MRNFEVLYSVFGIKSKKRNIVLVNGLFRDNGQFNFTINDDIMMVEEKLSYSYNAQKEKKSDTTSKRLSRKEKRIALLPPQKRKQRTGSTIKISLNSNQKTLLPTIETKICVSF